MSRKKKKNNHQVEARLPQELPFEVRIEEQHWNAFQGNLILCCHICIIKFKNRQSIVLYQLSWKLVRIAAPYFLSGQLTKAEQRKGSFHLHNSGQRERALIKNGYNFVKLSTLGRIRYFNWLFEPNLIFLFLFHQVSTEQ